MKNFIILLFLLNSIFCFSQSYKFNILTNYKSENGFYKESTVYSNKENDNYFLKVIKYSDNKTQANLIDLKESKKHIFNVVQHKNNSNEIYFNFTYIESYDYKIEDPLKTFRFKFKTIKEDKLSKMVKMSVNNKRGRPMGTYNLKIKKYPYNLFPVFRYSCLHPFEFSKDKKIEGTGIVQTYTSRSTSKKKYIYIYLDYFKEVDFELKVLK